jgi:hypothetical protein
MKNLAEQLQQLDRAVPDAPDFAAAMMRRIRALPSPVAVAPTSRWSRARFALGAAACVLIGLGAAAVVLLSTLSPQKAFGRAAERTAKFDSVRYWDRSSNDRDKSRSDDHRTWSTGGRQRSEISNGDKPPILFIHNPMTSPQLDLEVYSSRKTACFLLVDADREAMAGERDDPAKWMRDLAARHVVAAPDENYRGKVARVYVAMPAEHFRADGRWRTTRALVDRDSGLPLRIELESDGTYQGTGIVHRVLDDFEWDPKIDDGIFSTEPPPRCKVIYDLITPLVHGLEAYASRFALHLPDQLDAAAVKSFEQRVKRQTQSAGDGAASVADVRWGFAVPAVAARLGIDLRYYGARKSLVVNGPTRDIIAAVESAPGSGNYDVLMSDASRAQMDRSQLP